MLSACDHLGVGQIEKIFENAQTTEDLAVKRRLFTLCVKHQGPTYGRVLLNAIVSEETALADKMAMSGALIDSIETVRLTKFDIKDAVRLLSHQRMNISLHLAIVLGATLPLDIIPKLTEWLSKSTIRHGLLIPLAQGVSQRKDSPNYNPQIDALRYDVRDRVRAALNEGPMLPRTGLKALGHINVLDVLINFYGDALFEPKS